MSFAGTITALITPFKEGRLDEQGLRKNIWFQMEEGIDALLILGTTGEGATLTREEQKRVIQIAVEEKKVPLLVNAGDLSTARSIEKVQEAERMGVDGVLMIAPYYNRPSQEGLALHFEAIAKETTLPMILYNHPKRTGVEFSLDVLKRLSKQKNIIGIKDASASIPYAAAILDGIPDFLLFAGDDLMSLPLLSIGGNGLISVLSNLMPHKVSEMVRNQDQALYRALFPFMLGTQMEINPVPIKAMMELAKLPAGDPRLPLASLSKENHSYLKDLVLSSSLIPAAVYE